MNILNKISLLKKLQIILIVILLFGSFLRVYKLDTNPPALNWDEVAAGYNAYTIANWGHDEWGNFFPLVFKSFADDKHPVHIYITALFVKLFGLSDFVTRLPSAVAGILSIYLIYKLAVLLFKDRLAGVLSALLLSVSPYHIQFSRGLWESNFALTFFLLGLVLFYKGIDKNNKSLVLSFLSFGISLFSYHSAKIVVPIVVFVLIAIYIKSLIKIKTPFFIGIFIFLGFMIILLMNPRLIGFARADQTKPSNESIQNTFIYKKTQNESLARFEIALNRYYLYYKTDYLFISGDQTPRNSTKVFGQFYKIEAVLILVGLIFLLKRPKVSFVLLTWLLVSPIAGALSSSTPNANRAIFMLGALVLLSGLGGATMINFFKGKWKYFVLSILLAIMAFESLTYLKYYFNEYPKKDSIDWVYGMKQITDYVKENPQYDQVYMTNIRSQPYIFFLYYLKIPLPEYLKNIFENTTDSKSFNSVAMFDKYIFEGWDPIESFPNKDILYIVGPSHYDGLRHKSEFEVKKAIYYPNGLEAFFIVSGKK